MSKKQSIIVPLLKVMSQFKVCTFTQLFERVKDK